MAASFFPAMRRARPFTAARIHRRLHIRHFSSFWKSTINSQSHKPESDPTISELHVDRSNSTAAFTKPADCAIDENAGETMSANLGNEDIGMFSDTLLQGMDKAYNAGGFEWSRVHNPVDAVVALLDAIHSGTGSPWWLTIAGSTLALRASLFPLTAIQLKKALKFSKLLPHLPSPIPMNGSGKPYLEQWRTFRQRCREVEAPSPLWLIVVPLVHIPIFVSWIFAVRKMALAHYPGFELGGALWFVDLTSPPQGAIGAILPLLVAITYFTNIEVSFKSSVISGGMMPLMKWYKWWLQFLTIPALYVGFSLPQGIFMYWLPNNLCSLAQTTLLKNPEVRTRLGIILEPVKSTTLSRTQVKNEKAVEDLKYDELIVLAAERVAKRQHRTAIELLHSALQKSPGNVEAYIALGKLHLDQQEFDEAAEYYNLAATKAKDDAVLIVAKSGAGVSLFNQGKKSEAIAELRIVESLQEPDDDLSRRRYFRALVILGSALYQKGEKLEALDILRRAAKFDPSVQKFYVSKLEEELGLGDSPSTTG